MYVAFRYFREGRTQGELSSRTAHMRASEVQLVHLITIIIEYGVDMNAIALELYQE